MNKIIKCPKREMPMINEWSGLADLLANLIEKYRIWILKIVMIQQ